MWQGYTFGDREPVKKGCTYLYVLTFCDFAVSLPIWPRSSFLCGQLQRSLLEDVSGRDGGATERGFPTDRWVLSRVFKLHSSIELSNICLANAASETVKVF